MDERLKIVIIDSGVKKTHKAFEHESVVEISLNGEEPTQEVNYGHGTAIYNIIRKEANENTEIINMRIENIHLGVEARVIVEAIYKSVSMKADIINLSLGLTVCDDIISLREACEYAEKQGVMIVSAFSNDGSMSYPAAFPCVIGVTGSQEYNKNDEWGYIEDTIINVIANGNIQRVAWDYPDYIALAGNSFGAAHVTAILTHIMKKNDTKLQVLEKLRQGAKEIIKINKPQENKTLFPIKRASIFPFSKEMRSMLAFQDLLLFKIDAVYDVKYSGKVGAMVSQLMHGQKIQNDYQIRNIVDVDWEHIDTFILGHLGELSQRINQETLRENIIEQCLKHNVKLVSFDEMEDERLSDKNLYVPIIEDIRVLPKRQGKLYRYNKPILGVYGTSSKQGKFTLQLILRKKLIEQGYKIGQIGTEPSSLLYGMDYVYPMGYNSTVKLKEYDTIQYINNMVHSLCEKDIDLIITGSQSGTVPYDYGNLSLYLLAQYQFLTATQPDAVVLCINIYDDMNYIKRTIQFIEAASPSKVIALVVFPMKIQNNGLSLYQAREKVTRQEFLTYKEEYEKQFVIPVFELGDEEDMAQLIETVLNFYSE